MSLLAKRYLPASFRGVNFKVENVDLDAGRRVATHEYPYKNAPYSEDLGRKKREWAIEAYVLGADYEASRDKLLAAIETEGPGVLVHPYYGTLSVICTGCKLRESKTELGICYFSLSFIESGLKEFPEVGTDPSVKVLSTVEELQAISSTAFEKIYSVVDAPSFVLDSAESKLTNFTNVVEGEATKIRGVTERLADYTYQIRNMKADVRTIAQTPSRVAANFVNTLNSLLAILPGGTKQMKSAFRGISRYGVDFDTSNTSTSSRLNDAANAGALSALSFQLVTGLMASEAASRIYNTFDDAVTDRDEVLAMIDEILESTRDDNVYRGFHRLRARLASAVPNPTQDLSQISTVELGEVTPSLVLAYDLYNSFDFETDIIERNHIKHPGFLPALRELKVLRQA